MATKKEIEQTEALLAELTEAGGVAGYEREISAVLRKHFDRFGAVSSDRMGSLICAARGAPESPRVMLAGHMDEIGFMIRAVTPDGFLKFTPLGGWWDQVLLAQRVLIKTSKGEVEGVIGAKPPHLIPQEDRSKMVQKKSMYIDIGASSDKEVEKAGVRAGDPAVPVSGFTKLAIEGVYMAKAFDDRVGCAALISVLGKLKKPPCAVYGVATVQEEVGIRGATTSARAVDPDAAIILESDISGDVPGISNEESSTKLGGGPSLLLYDARMIPNLKLRDLVVDTAKKAKIPLQFASMEGGATDGGAIHLHKQGVPTVVLGVPTRHIHSHNSIIQRKDFENTVKLVVEVVKRLDKKMVEGLVN